MKKTLNKLINNEKEFIASLKQINYGSSRKVFYLTKNKVLKVAKNRKGIAQNKAEVEIFESSERDYFATIYYYSEDFSWVIAEYCRPLFGKIPKRIVDYIYNQDILYECDEFGKNVKGKIKIIDYGGTNEVIYKYY